MSVAAREMWRKRLGVFFLALFFWMVLIAVDTTSWSMARIWPDGLRRATVSWTIWALLTPLIITADRLLPISREALFGRFVFHIPLSLSFTALKHLLQSITLSFLRSEHPRPLLRILRNSFSGPFQASYFGYWIIVLFYFAFEYRKYMHERELQALRLERRISESRLETLRAQLRPNLLFNALSAISASLERSPRTARRMLEEVGELLRLSLAPSEDEEIPLAQEIGFLEHYLEIQKVKFQERLGATVKVDAAALPALVPTFILQPLVQAAILYGMSSDVHKSCVEVRAWRDREQLYLRVQDDGPRFVQGANAGDTFDIGVSNTRERLKCLYGEQDQTFEVLNEPGKGIRVDLSIPFRNG